MQKGTTEQILAPLLEGMRAEGCEVEVFNARKVKVEPCFGDFACWGRTPGECVLKDDMQALYPKFTQDDIWVFGVPYYCITPGEVQNILNRLVALLEPTMQSDVGLMVPTRRPELRVKRVVLVSTCYFWEVEQFDPMVRVFDKLGAILGVEVNHLLRPHAAAYVHMLGTSPEAKQVRNGERTAGMELARSGSISREDFVKMHDKQFNIEKKS
jgi:multimeric flavodoxin WrbA